MVGKSIFRRLLTDLFFCEELFYFAEYRDQPFGLGGYATFLLDLAAPLAVLKKETTSE